MEGSAVRERPLRLHREHLPDADGGRNCPRHVWTRCRDRGRERRDVRDRRLGPTADAIAVALEHGVSLDGHRARQLTPELVAGADLVVGMEREHVAFARRLGAVEATTLGVPVRDPYGLGAAAYRETWSLLASLVPELVRTIRAPRQ